MREDEQQKMSLGAEQRWCAVRAGRRRSPGDREEIALDGAGSAEADHRRTFKRAPHSEGCEALAPRIAMGVRNALLDLMPEWAQNDHAGYHNGGADEGSCRAKSTPNRHPDECIEGHDDQAQPESPVERKDDRWDRRESDDREKPPPPLRRIAQPGQKEEWQQHPVVGTPVVGKAERRLRAGRFMADDVLNLGHGRVDQYAHKFDVRDAPGESELQRGTEFEVGK